MRPQFLNLAHSSFLLFLNNYILKRGSGVAPVSSKFYPIGQSINGVYTYAAPYQPIVYDSSICQPMTGVYINSQPIQRGVSGFIDINYQKGEVYFNNNVNQYQVSGDYMVAEIQVLPLTVSEEKLLLETKFNLRNKTTQTLSGLNSDSYTYPSIYVKGFKSDNTPYAFGGEELSDTTIGLFLLMSNSYQLDAIKSILTDMEQELVPFLTQDQFPFDIYGGFKNTGSNFNYDTLKTTYLNANSGMYVKDVVVNTYVRQYESETKSLNPDVYWALADITICKTRFPRNIDNNL